MQRKTTVLSATLCSWAILGSSAAGQTLNVSGGTTRVAGPDFATVVVGDPWDFSQRTDYVYMFSEDAAAPGQSSWSAVPTVAGGVLTGVARAAIPTMQIQFEGITGALNLVDRNGVRYPIDPARFNRLSFRMRRSVTPAANNETFEATWYKTTTRDASSVGGQLALTRGFTDQIGRYVNQSPVASQTATSYHIYKLDLDHPANALKYGASYAGLVRGLRVGLGNSGALVGATIDVDWVRLTERGAATMTLSWSGFGGAVTLTATRQGSGDVVQIFPDNGTRDTTFADNSNVVWDYGFLPPGVYTLTASGNGRTAQRTVTVDAAPVITVTEPDASGGLDFASSVLGDAWDLTNVQDVLRYGRLWQVSGEAYTESGLTGNTTGDDPFVQMVDDWDDPPGSALGIDANRFRRLTFTIDYTDRKDLTGPVALGPQYGGVARVGWRRSDNNGGPYTVTQDLFPLDGGPVTYSIDLGSLRTPGDGSSLAHDLEAPATDFWQGAMGNLRIDINEAILPRSFKLSNVKLAADDAPNSYGFFTIKWIVADALFSSGLSDGGGSDATVALYYDTDQNPTNGRTLIASGIPATAGQYGWNVAGLGAGAYYIYTEITDGVGNAQGRYSTGPLRITSTIPPPTDADGDGMADSWEAKYGLTSPSADADGDGIDNLTEYRNGTNPLLANTWYLSEGATGFFRERIALANPDADQADVTIRFLRESGDPVIRTYSVPPYGRVTVTVNDVAGLAQAAVSAVVTSTTGGVVVERTMLWDANYYGGHTGKGIAQPRTRWYLAEGEANFFSTYILLANATASTAQVTATYLLDTGSTVVRNYTVAANSRLTIYANDIPGVQGRAFSTTIDSTVPITVERAMYFTSGGRFWNGGTNAAAVEAPSTSWFVAEGRTGPFFDMFLLLANPNGSPASATVRYLRPGGAVVTRTYSLPATSRTTVWVDAEPGLGDTEVSASISATLPIIVERAMYWPGSFTSWYEAHASAAVTTTGTRWALAEGEYGGNLNFQTWILLANPSASEAAVRLTALRTSGQPVSIDFTIPANSRVSKSAGDLGLGSGERFGVLAEALNGVPIVVERAMYWNAAGQFWGGGTNETAVKLR
jgi:hypothetical protein